MWIAFANNPQAPRIVRRGGRRRQDLRSIGRKLHRRRVSSDTYRAVAVVACFLCVPCLTRVSGPQLQWYATQARQSGHSRTMFAERGDWPLRPAAFFDTQVRGYGERKNIKINAESLGDEWLTIAWADTVEPHVPCMRRCDSDMY